jgi:N-methylhydantoinase B/oxoprolinase/acetone carboxylase alpha subunit
MSEKLLDGVELAILFNRFEGIVRKMSNTLYRTGRSGVLNRARDFSCCITSRSLYERANGYNYEAVKIFMAAGSKQPVVVHYVEHMPPDVTAGIFWLKGRTSWR